MQQVAQPDDAILDRFRIDAVDIGRAFNARDEDWYDITLPDGPAGPVSQPGSTPCPSPTAPGMPLRPTAPASPPCRWAPSFFDQTCFPYVDGYPDNFDNLSQVMPLVHWSGLAHSPWDHAGEPDFWEQLRASAPWTCARTPTAP